jgi:hypothetical protein
MLLFVRNPYYSAILDGSKRYELRAGPRYRNLCVGSTLSINGRVRKIVRRVERFSRPEEASRASRAAGYYLSVAAIRACYPDASDLVMLHF